METSYPPHRIHLGEESPADDTHSTGYAQSTSWTTSEHEVEWMQRSVQSQALASHLDRSAPALLPSGSGNPELTLSDSPLYDPTAALHSFHALHITDTVPHAPGVASDSAQSHLTSRSSNSGHERRPLHSNTMPSRAHSANLRRGEEIPIQNYSEGYDYQMRGHYDDSASQDPYTQSYSNHPHSQDYNALYIAASDVVSLPPGSTTPYSQQDLMGPTSDRRFAQSVSSLSSNASAPAPSTSSGASIQHSVFSLPGTSTEFATEETEIEERPSFRRSGTTASVTPSTQKTKAVDLRSPPYTKQYIDDYRQRIKADPDPEAHFAYARYLIDAARRIGADAKDQRGVRKYRDALIQEALKVIRRLATQGQPYDEAQFFLANCYGTGTLGLQVDHEKAYHLYLQAAKQNHAAATYRVAVCNEIGAGTRREPPRAAAFYRKAASLGDTPAMYKLGMILLQGSLGEAHNPREAVGWLRRAAEQADEEYPHALHELALLHENPNNQVVPYDLHQARELYTRAAHLGYTQSQYKLGQCYEYGALGCLVDPRRSIAWYTKAAEKGNSEAELALSGWYLTGSEGVLKQSDSEAYLWARRAANKGLSKAEYAVGYYAEVGIGIKQDIEFAKRWYMRAAAQGNKRAMSRLTEMKRQGTKRANMSRPTRQQAEKECVIA